MNELETLPAGEIQPFDPGQPLQELQPLSPSPDTWGRSNVDTYQHSPSQSQQTLWGAALPAGTSQQQVDNMLGQLAGAFQMDFSQLGYPAHMINAAVKFMTENALKKPYQVQARHSFNLHGHSDYLGTAFGNMVAGLNGSPRAKQQFVTACLKWLTKATKQTQPEGSSEAHGSAPNSSQSLLNNLSEADYAKVVKINNDAKAKTMQVLAAKHGEYSVQQVVEIGQKYLESLPANERAHFDQFTTSNGVPWVHMLNTPEALEALYGMAIGANSINRNDGASIAREIAGYEAMLKVPSERAKYMKDPQTQARLRELYTIRDGG